MSSFAEVLRDGIEKGDWGLVCESYEMLTGIELNVPAATSDETSQEAKQFLLHLGVLINEFVNDEYRTEIVDVDDAREATLSKEPEEDHVSARARQVKEVVRGNRRGVEDDFEKFRVDHSKVRGGTSEEGQGRPCKRLPFEKGNHKNEFKDDLTEAANEIKQSKAMLKGRKPTTRRPPAKHVEAKCVRCTKLFSVPLVLAPKKIGDAKDANVETSFICDNCQPKGGR